MKEKILLIICDGMGDLPQKVLGGKTPLEAAHTPNMDYFAKEGKTGRMYTLGKGITPESDNAHLALLGYDLRTEYCGRGPLEAAGIKMKLKKGDVALRANFGTVNAKGVIVDRRAGRIEDVRAFVKKLNGMKIKGVKFLVQAGTAHRAVVVMRGKGLSEKISNNDLHKTGIKPVKVKALVKSKKARFTAEVLNEFLEESHKILDKFPENARRKKNGKLVANYLLVRGAGEFKRIDSLKKKYGLSAACVAGGGLYKGVASVAGMKVLKVKGTTGRVKTNLRGKFSAVVTALRRFDFVFLHLKGTDILGHDGKCKEKMEFIERIDREIKVLRDLKDTVIVVTADHCTPCSKEDHSADPVPLLIYGKGNDSVKAFSEKACGKGSLGVILGKNLMKEISELPLI